MASNSFSVCATGSLWVSGTWMHMRLDVHPALEMLPGPAWMHHIVAWALHLGQNILGLELLKGSFLSFPVLHHKPAHPIGTCCPFC